MRIAGADLRSITIRLVIRVTAAGAQPDPTVTGHLAAALFESMAGVRMTHVPYKGLAPALADLLSGEVHLMFSSLVAILPHVEAGRLRALALTGTARSPLLPNVPTIAESGLPGYESTSWYGFLAPRGTPRMIVGKLHTGIAKAMAMPELRERYLNEGGDATVRGPDEFAAIIHEQLPKWAKVVKDSGARVD